MIFRIALLIGTSAFFTHPMNSFANEAASKPSILVVRPYWHEFKSNQDVKPAEKIEKKIAKEEPKAQPQKNPQTGDNFLAKIDNFNETPVEHIREGIAKVDKTLQGAGDVLDTNIGDVADEIVDFFTRVGRFLSQEGKSNGEVTPSVGDQIIAKSGEARVKPVTSEPLAPVSSAIEGSNRAPAVITTPTSAVKNEPNLTSAQTAPTNEQVQPQEIGAPISLWRKPE